MGNETIKEFFGLRQRIYIYKRDKNEEEKKQTANDHVLLIVK